jgi:hypothetical protein
VGCWRVRVRIGITAREITGRGHEGNEFCDDLRCGWVVEEHQKWGKPEEGDVPEFTIEVAYKAYDHVGNPVSPGWRYILKWLESGQRKQVRDYGYATEAEAIAAARTEADRIALSLAPVHVETYRPEI